MELIVASQREIGHYAKALKEGLELSAGARSTSTYYHSKEEQRTAIRRKVIELYRVDKAIPLLLASMEDCTHYFRQEVLLQELRGGAFNGKQSLVNSGAWLDDGMQTNMILHILSKLPFTYALRFFGMIRDEGINNGRTRRLMVRWLIGNLNDFTAMKYRSKIRRALKHAYGRNTYLGIIKGLRSFLEDGQSDYQRLYDNVFKYTRHSSEAVAKWLLHVERRGQAEWYTGPNMKHLTAFYKACNASTKDEFYDAARWLDADVARGIISLDAMYNPLFQDFYEGGKMKEEVTKRLLEKSKVISDDQKVRTKELQKRVGAQVREDVNYEKVGTESLYKTRGVKEARKARVEKDKLELPYASIGIIVDRSISNDGGRDSSNTPAAIIQHLESVLMASVERSTVAYTPRNQTDLTKPLIEILKANRDVDAIFVLSDGYENFPYEGCFDDMVAREGVQAIHCSPYVSAEMKAQARGLGPNVVTMAVNKPAQITTQMQARLLDFDPRQYFKNQFSRFLPETVNP